MSFQSCTAELGCSKIRYFLILGSGYTQKFIRNIHACGNEVISLRYSCTLRQHYRPVQTHVDIGDWLGICKNLDLSYRQG